jgi:hydrogenase expression/formation protein HypC
MCLGVPGQVLEIHEGSHGIVMGSVSFGGIKKEICLSYVPDVRVGDHVIVHVGFAISRIDEREAREVFRTLEEMGELAELTPWSPTRQVTP